MTYFSAAGNQANGGYLSNFRAARGTITGIGSGTFMNFNPNGGTQCSSCRSRRPIANARLVFQFDQPFADSGAGRRSRTS